MTEERKKESKATGIGLTVAGAGAGVLGAALLAQKGPTPPPGGGGVTGPFDVHVLSDVYPPNQPRFITGRTQLSKSGAPQNLPSVVIPDGFSVVLRARKANSGTITIADNQGDAVNAGTTSFELAAGDAVELLITNLNEVWFDGTVTGDQLEYIVEQA